MIAKTMSIASAIQPGASRKSAVGSAWGTSVPAWVAASATWTFSDIGHRRLHCLRRLRAADRQIESLALLDVYGRVARTLLDMSEMDGELKIIRNKVSRQDLAKVVGASREMVSRVMKDLEGRGMVQTQENGWVVIKELTAN